jgi:hypothetical protein
VLARAHRRDVEHEAPGGGQRRVALCVPRRVVDLDDHPLRREEEVDEVLAEHRPLALDGDPAPRERGEERGVRRRRVRQARLPVREELLIEPHAGGASLARRPLVEALLGEHRGEVVDVNAVAETRAMDRHERTHTPERDQLSVAVIVARLRVGQHADRGGFPIRGSELNNHIAVLRFSSVPVMQVAPPTGTVARRRRFGLFISTPYSPISVSATWNVIALPSVKTMIGFVVHLSLLAPALSVSVC